MANWQSALDDGRAHVTGVCGEKVSWWQCREPLVYYGAIVVCCVINVKCYSR